MLQAIKVIEIGANNPSFEVKREWLFSLNNLQNYVDGYVEAFRVNESITMWFNEEGNMRKLEPNIIIVDENERPLHAIRGNILITGTDSEGDSISLTDEEIGFVLECFIHRRMFKLKTTNK